MKNKTIKLFLTLIIILITVEPINASSGKLKGASVVSCNGVNYGSHSSDNHWHKAKKHDSGWYPDGGVVSASNPCAAAPAPAPKKQVEVAPKKETAAEIEKRKELERINAEKKKAEIAEAEKIQAEKIELERIEKEKLAETLRLEKIKQDEIIRVENIRLNNTDVSDVTLNDSKDIMISHSNLLDIENIKISLSNPSASLDSVEVTTTDVFKYNDLIINVISENGLISKPTKKSFYLLGDNNDLLKQKLDFSYENKEGKITLDYIEGIHSMKIKSLKEIKNLPLKLETINGENIPLVSKVNVKQVLGNDYSHIIEIKMMEESFEIPLNIIIEKNSLVPVLFGFSSLLTLSGLGIYKKNKDKK